jgi:DNA polymerase III delta prime subunit
MDTSLEMLFGSHVSLDVLFKILMQYAQSGRVDETAFCIWGPPGIGKTQLTRALARELGIQYLRYNWATIDYTQVGGLPELTGAKEGNKRAVRYPIIHIPHEGKGILVLDDYTHGLNAIQNLGLELALERQLNDAKLGKGWMLILCANPEGGVHPMHPPVANRLTHFWVDANPQAWREWALDNDIRNEVIAFLDCSPEMLYQEPTKQEKAFPTPRSWERLSKSLDIFYSVSKEESVENEIDELQPDGTTKLVRTTEKETVVERAELGDMDKKMVTSLAASNVGQAGASMFMAYMATYGRIDFPKLMDGVITSLEPLVDKSSKNKDVDRKALEYAVLAHARGWWSTKAKRGRSAVNTKIVSNLMKVLGAPYRSALLRDMSRVDQGRMNALIKQVVNTKELEWVKKQFLDLGKIMTGVGLEDDA